ncbi:unnamed protein product [Parascedosporium putredinis]|uniref:Ribosomal RNA-processing protein 43 n=1 Tax=Parascedosporium putredinis TaxID=1442378 RepID=A0A9P1GVS2_9PEZI|nr:unnamed protein product [Parascedosporium putredinis]CAI7988262.1 unnamed protein product [Parascedosporium putredinis]
MASEGGPRGLPRATFAKLSPHPYLLANLEPSDEGTAPARSNGRAPRAARPPTVNNSSLTHANGSSLVRCGDTTVICGVRAETILTSDIPNFRPSNRKTELKDYDLLVPNLELATGCSPQFLPGQPPTTLAQTLSTRVYSLLHASKLVSPDDLRIWYTSPLDDEDDAMAVGDEEDEYAAGDSKKLVAYWVLYIDVFFISFDGNPLMPRSVGPRLGEDRLFSDDPVPLTINGMPIASTAAIFTGKDTDRPSDGKFWLLLDPDRLEESLCDEAITVVVDKSGGETKILSITKHGDTIWDVVICGTGLQQALLALALSRSDKKILHVDPNEYYGGPDAALTLQEVSRWVRDHAAADKDGVFKSASIIQAPESDSLPSRAYSISLSPQIIHARSALLSQLVSSRAYRQLEFLAVGIPSTREAVFLNSKIPVKAKRALMKFLKFVLDFESESQTGLWEPHAHKPLDGFLESEFKLDKSLRAYIITLTLSQSGEISVKDGLAIIHRHLNSMGMYGQGFAALYPKWGGTSEIAQVACRAGAVGGGIYMLGMNIKSQHAIAADENDGASLGVELDNGITVKARSLVRGCDEILASKETVSRLVAVIDSL